MRRCRIVTVYFVSTKWLELTWGEMNENGNFRWLKLGQYIFDRKVNLGEGQKLKWETKIPHGESTIENWHHRLRSHLISNVSLAPVSTFLTCQSSSHSFPPSFLNSSCCFLVLCTTSESIFMGCHIFFFLLSWNLSTWSWKKTMA